jgi:hypothetical protein
MKPQLPTLPMPDLRHKFYGKSTADNLIRKLLFAQNVARQNNKDASDVASQQFNSAAKPHIFSPQQLVLLDKISFLSKNQKLAPKWSGPHKMLRLKGDCNIKIQLKHNNQKTGVHANRLKPYFVALKNSAFCLDFIEDQQPATQPPAAIDTSPVMQTNDTVTTFYDNILTMPNLPNLQHTQMAQLQNQLLVINPPSIARHTCTRTCTASLLHTHTHSDKPPSGCTRLLSQLSCFSPLKLQLIMPQVTLHPLPIPKVGGGRGCRMKTKINVMRSSLSTF